MGARAGKVGGLPQEGAQGRPAIPPDLTMEIKQFVEENPDMGETNLSGFATNACKMYLAYLRRQKFMKLVTRSAKDGKLPQEALGKLRLPDDLQD